MRQAVERIALGLFQSAQSGDATLEVRNTATDAVFKLGVIMGARQYATRITLVLGQFPYAPQPQPNLAVGAAGALSDLDTTPTCPRQPAW